ncbi:hypothetical protein COCOBI_08-3570 [Coccomyxa sp. Obi]|nr:hypothetical protein COCOBI_08-3570 [Coccomyxa sp. Obi]
MQHRHSSILPVDTVKKGLAGLPSHVGDRFPSAVDANRFSILREASIMFLRPHPINFHSCEPRWPLAFDRASGKDGLLRLHSGFFT